MDKIEKAPETNPDTLERRRVLRAAAGVLGAIGATVALPRVARADITQGSGSGGSLTVTQDREYTYIDITLDGCNGGSVSISFRNDSAISAVGPLTISDWDTHPPNPC